MKDNVILCWCSKCNKFLTPNQVTEHFESDPYEEGAILSDTGEVRCDLCDEEVYFYEEDEEQSVLDFINQAYTSQNLTRLCEILESYNSWM